MNNDSLIICGWCTDPIVEGSVHLPTEIKGRCTIMDASVKTRRKKTTYPVNYIGSGLLHQYQHDIYKEIIRGIKERYKVIGDKDPNPSTIVVNFQIALMHFIQELLRGSEILMVQATHETFMDDMEGLN